jgi:hypothetical protein
MVTDEKIGELLELKKGEGENIWSVSFLFTSDKVIYS